MALYRTEAIVLRTRNLGEADRILTLYTKDRGKRNAVAKGSRRPRSRLLGVVQPFSHSRIMSYEGKSLDTMSQGELIHSFSKLRDDLLRMAYATYISELVDLLVEENEPGETLFPLLVNTLSRLEREDNLRLTARYFELHLMTELGYLPHLHSCLVCGSALEEPIRFSISGGGILCKKCFGEDANAHPVSLATVQIMRRLIEWEINRLGVVRPSEDTMRQLDRLMRNYVDYRLPRKLNSIEFLRSLEE